MFFPHKAKTISCMVVNLRLKDKLRKKVVEDVTDTVPAQLSVRELQRAEIALIEYVQKKAFPYLLSTVVNHAQNLKRCPRFMQKLCPVMFEGVIRVGGRLEKAEIDFDSKYPIILLMFSHFTELVIRKHHASVGHSGTSHTWAEVRQRYWIV